MTNQDREKGRLAADEAFDTDADRETIRAMLPEDREARAAFLERLAARAAIHGSEDVDEVAGPVPPSVAARVGAAYERERTTAARAEVDLASAAPWLAARDAFAGDTEFIMKLLGQRVTTPTTRFVRYVADALGASLVTVRRHFEVPAGLALAGVERKSPRKPGQPRVEDFGEAVRDAAVPQELKDRWLRE